MHPFFTSRRSKLTVAVGIMTIATSLLGFFGLWALAFAGTACGLTVIALLVAENVQRSRASAAAAAKREQQSLRGLNSSVARIETSLSRIVEATNGSTKQRSDSPISSNSTAASADLADVRTCLQSIWREREFAQWQESYGKLLEGAPHSATALALPRILSRLRQEHTLSFIGTPALASWAYETMLRRDDPPRPAYFGFRTAIDKNAFEKFVSEKSHRLEHASYLLESNPLPTASLGDLPAAAVDMMILDFGAWESDQEALESIPLHYWRWLPSATELIVVDSREGLVSRATNSVLRYRDDFVVAFDSETPYSRYLKRAAL